VCLLKATLTSNPENVTCIVSPNAHTYRLFVFKEQFTSGAIAGSFVSTELLQLCDLRDAKKRDYGWPFFLCQIA
jgi:hypothetical protein